MEKKCIFPICQLLVKFLTMFELNNQIILISSTNRHCCATVPLIHTNLCRRASREHKSEEVQLAPFCLLIILKLLKHTLYYTWVHPKLPLITSAQNTQAILPKLRKTNITKVSHARGLFTHRNFPTKTGTFQRKNTPQNAAPAVMVFHFFYFACPLSEKHLSNCDRQRVKREEK